MALAVTMAIIAMLVAIKAVLAFPPPKQLWPQPLPPLGRGGHMLIAHEHIFKYMFPEIEDYGVLFELLWGCSVRFESLRSSRRRSPRGARRSTRFGELLRLKHFLEQESEISSRSG